VSEAELPPRLASLLQRALEALATGEPLEGEVRDAVLLVVADRYYGAPEVRAALGYPGPRAIPMPPLPDARDAELEPLLQRVRDRGPIYRDTSPSSSTTASQ
jgi:hypothetical protein